MDGAVAKTAAALGSDGEAEVAVSHKRKKRKQQSSVAVEPKSKEANTVSEINDRVHCLYPFRMSMGPLSCV